MKRDPESASIPAAVSSEAHDSRPEWREWLASPAGRYVLAWERDHLDRQVADLFGFVALQCGLPELDSLAQSRMRSRGLVTRPYPLDADGTGLRRPDVVIDHYEELPFASQSVDLVVLPHVLEFARDPHQVLREVDRILRPEGRVIITGFNPVSLWGLRQAVSRARGRHWMPADEHFIGLPRLRDWFKLLSFEFDRGRYGCWRPPMRTQRGLDRTAFMEGAGDRWWPILGAVYSVSAIKRVRGMRLMGPAWRTPKAKRAPAVAVAPNLDAPTLEPPHRLESPRRLVPVERKRESVE